MKKVYIELYKDKFHDAFIHFIKNGKGLEFNDEFKKIGVEFEELITSTSLNKLEEFHNSFKTYPLAKEIGNYYEKFRQRDFVINLYSHEMNINSCLYCNAQFSARIISKKLGLELDHFYNKDDYPLLALSFINLIPVCSSCNKKKSKKDKVFFYPYVDDIDQITHFDLSEIGVVKYLLGYPKEDFIEWNLTDNTYQNKFDEHLNTFEIEKLYNSNFKEIVAGMLDNMVYYNKSRIDEIKSLGFIDDNMIERLKTGNYTNSEDINLRPLSKLNKDISERLGLI